MLLLDVQVEIDSAKEGPLNEWYATHVPRLVSVPGYEGGRRYVSMTAGPRHNAFYEVRAPEDLRRLLGGEESERDPVTLSEWEVWDRDLVPAMSHQSLGVYEPVGAGRPRPLGGDGPIVKLTIDGTPQAAEAVTDWWRDHACPALASQSDVVDALLMQLTDEESVQWLHQGLPRYLVIIECAGTVAARRLAAGAGDLLLPLPASAKAIAYRPVARHWPLQEASS